jgi:hypothetical protein
MREKNARRKCRLQHVHYYSLEISKSAQNSYLNENDLKKHMKLKEKYKTKNLHLNSNFANI